MAPETSARPLPLILALGTTQTLAWASSYYLPAILADPIARDLGVSSNWRCLKTLSGFTGKSFCGPMKWKCVSVAPGGSLSFGAG